MGDCRECRHCEYDKEEQEYVCVNELSEAHGLMVDRETDGCMDYEEEA